MNTCRSKYGVSNCRAGMRCPVRANPSTYVPRNSPLKAYYEATDKKHFHGGAETPGSKFLDPSLNSIEDVVTTLLDSNRDLFNDDDRSIFIKEFGCKETDFIEGYRYLMMETHGTLGAINSNSLKNTDLVEVVRTKPGSTCSLVKEVEQQQLTNVAVVIIADHNDTGLPFVITCFPGVPTKPVANADIDELEGQVITVGTAKKVLGTESFWVNTKVQAKNTL